MLGLKFLMLKLSFMLVKKTSVDYIYGLIDTRQNVGSLHIALIREWNDIILKISLNTEHSQYKKSHDVK